ncbi:MAG TPA: glycosyltransferase, partial [Roseiflexaceae bacterium]|nr:glycosyltransferase [Roseiflexaceae bacterium]
MSFEPSQPLRVAMLARVVFPLHGFGGIERHVFHLVTHLARLGVHVTLYVQHPTEDKRQETGDRRSQSDASPVSRLSSLVSMVFRRYDYT